MGLYPQGKECTVRRLLTLPRSARVLPALVLFGTSALLFASGCSDSNDATTSPDPTNQEEEAIPTISDVQNEVALTAEQAAEVERALNQWRIESRRSENMEDVLLEDAPAVAFLARASETLNEAQMTALREMAGRAVSARADEFRPERFLGSRPQPYAWIPFGGGIKRCIGAAFAMCELVTVLHTVLREGSLEPVSSRPETPPWRAAPVLVPRNGTRVYFTNRVPVSP